MHIIHYTYILQLGSIYIRLQESSIVRLRNGLVSNLLFYANNGMSLGRAWTGVMKLKVWNILVEGLECGC